MTIWYGPGLGIGMSFIVTFGPLETTADFIVEANRVCEAMVDSLFEVVKRRGLSMPK